MSDMGFDSGFYTRLDQFSRALNRVLIAAKSNAGPANQEDWDQVSDLVQTLASHRSSSLAASSVAASLLGKANTTAPDWESVVQALAGRDLNQGVIVKLSALAWSLDEERAEVLARMRHCRV